MGICFAIAPAGASVQPCLKTGLGLTYLPVVEYCPPKTKEGWPVCLSGSRLGLSEAD